MHHSSLFAGLFKFVSPSWCKENCHFITDSKSGDQFWVNDNNDGSL